MPKYKHIICIVSGIVPALHVWCGACGVVCVNGEQVVVWQSAMLDGEVTYLVKSLVYEREP